MFQVWPVINSINRQSSKECKVNWGNTWDDGYNAFLIYSFLLYEEEIPKSLEQKSRRKRKDLRQESNSV